MLGPCIINTRAPKDRGCGKRGSKYKNIILWLGLCDRLFPAFSDFAGAWLQPRAWVQLYINCLIVITIAIVLDQADLYLIYNLISNAAVQVLSFQLAIDGMPFPKK